MIRRSSTLLTALAAAVALSGCATFDTDVVAEVDGNELTRGDLDELLAGAGVVVDGERAAGDDARQVIVPWMIDELLRAEIASLGGDEPEPATDDDPWAALNADIEAASAVYRAFPTDAFLDDEVRELYESGMENSGLVCPAHILVETEDEADQILADLADGADFAQLAQERSLDTGSGAAGGALGCQSPDSLGQYVPEFADAVASAEIGVASDPVETDFGFHVIRLQPVDELPSDAIGTLRLATFEDRYGITIDPKFGTWDPEQLVVALG